MRPLKRGIAIPHDLYVVIQDYAKKFDVSANHVIVRMLQVAKIRLDLAGGVGYPADCAHVSQVPMLSEITHGKFLMSRRRLVKLLGLPTARHKRFRALVRDGIVEIQQSGFVGDSMHHEKLAKIRRDIRLAL
jgi:hypothetical protein